MASIVVVDLDHDMAALVAYALRRDGHSLQLATQAPYDAARLVTGGPHALVLSAQLPNALELCRAIRALAQVPIILFNGSYAEEDEVAALDQGADVYMAPPLDLLMLRARVRALVRRAPPAPPAGVSTPK